MRTSSTISWLTAACLLAIAVPLQSTDGKSITFILRDGRTFTVPIG